MARREQESMDGVYQVARFSFRGFGNEEMMFASTAHTEEGCDRKMLRVE